MSKYSVCKHMHTITRRTIEMDSGKRHRVSFNQKLTNQHSPRIPRGHFVKAQLER